MRTTCRGGYDFRRTIPENLFKIPLVLKSVTRTCCLISLSHVSPVAFVHDVVRSALVTTYHVASLFWSVPWINANRKSWSFRLVEH